MFTRSCLLYFLFFHFLCVNHLSVFSLCDIYISLPRSLSSPNLCCFHVLIIHTTKSPRSINPSLPTPSTILCLALLVFSFPFSFKWFAKRLFSLLDRRRRRSSGKGGRRRCWMGLEGIDGLAGCSVASSTCAGPAPPLLYILRVNLCVPVVFLLVSFFHSAPYHDQDHPGDVYVAAWDDQEGVCETLVGRRRKKS